MEQYGAPRMKRRKPGAIDISCARGELSLRLGSQQPLAQEMEKAPQKPGGLLHFVREGVSGFRTS